MDIGSGHPGPRRSRLSRLAPWIVGILAAGIAWLLLSPLLLQQTYPYIEYGCLYSAPKDPVKVGDIESVEAVVTYGKCIDTASAAAQIPNTGLNPWDETLPVPVGGRARLELKAPLSPVTIKPLSEELLPIESAPEYGQWYWELRADEPGDHRLSFVVTIFAADGKTVLAQKQEPLAIHAEGTATYYLGIVWRGFRDFVTATQTIVVALAAVFGTIAGGLVKVQQRRRKAGGSDTSAGSREGYL